MFSFLFNTLLEIQNPKTKKAAMFSCGIAIFCILLVILFPDWCVAASILIAMFAALFKFVEYSFITLRRSFKVLKAA